MTKLRQLSTDRNAYSFSFDVDLLQNIKETYQNNIAPFFAAPAPVPLFEGGIRAAYARRTQTHMCLEVLLQTSPVLRLFCKTICVKAACAKPSVLLWGRLGPICSSVVPG